MNNPYEDLEYLSENLPDEGESVIISRRRGQLVCEPFMDSQTSSESTAGVINREFYGRLVATNAKLRHFWSRPLILALLLIYAVSIGMQQFFHLGWSDWVLYLAAATVILVSVGSLVRFRQRIYFRSIVCPLLQQLMSDHQIDKYSLIAYLSTQRQLGPLYVAMTRWT